jgi:hypothetical protein
MDPNRSDFGLAGTTSFGIHATLYSDGTARGHVNCVDQVGSTFPGNIFGEVTSWEGSLDGSISLNVVGKLVGFPGGHPQDVSFTVTIQPFGGAGVGQASGPCPLVVPPPASRPCSAGRLSCGAPPSKGGASAEWKRAQDRCHSPDFAET